MKKLVSAMLAAVFALNSCNTFIGIGRDTKQGYYWTKEKIQGMNGGGGGVGTFAIQIAKANGAQVTGVDGPGKLEAMRSVGADNVVDFTSEDFTRSGQRYDLILDVVGRRSLRDYRRALRPGGVCGGIGV